MMPCPRVVRRPSAPTALAVLALVLLGTIVVPPAAGGEKVDFRMEWKIEVHEDRSERAWLTIYSEIGDARVTWTDLCLPTGATAKSVYDDQGVLRFSRATVDGQSAVSFTTRSWYTTVEMTRVAPEAAEIPVYEVGLDACNYVNTVVEGKVLLPAGFRFVGYPLEGTLSADRRTLTLPGDSARWARYAYEAPVPAGSDYVVFEEGAFRVFVPGFFAAEARNVTAVATPLVEAAAEEAGLAIPWKPLSFLFESVSAFGWEGGYYGGNGFIRSRRALLNPDPEEGYPFTALDNVIHESFHALSVPRGEGGFAGKISWFVEGSAVNAERAILAAYPEGLQYCNARGTCWDFDGRLDHDELVGAYEGTWIFDATWTPDREQTDDTRSFYYDYAGFVVGAYVRRAGGEAYQAVWRELTEAFKDDAACPCDEAWLTAALLRHAPANMTEFDLYHPYRVLRTTNETAFRAEVSPLLAPESAYDEERSAPGALGAPDPATVQEDVPPQEQPGPLVDDGAAPPGDDDAPAAGGDEELTRSDWAIVVTSLALFGLMVYGAVALVRRGVRSVVRLFRK